jgi:hypothetical protein
MMLVKMLVKMLAQLPVVKMTTLAVSSENGEIVGLLFYTMMLPLSIHIEIRFGDFIHCSCTAYQGNGHPIYSSETVKEMQDHCNEIIQVSISRGDILGKLMT